MTSRVVLPLALCVAFAGLAPAQGTRASITGIVKDPSGAVVPGVELMLRSRANASLVRATSANDGFYAFPAIAAGVYDLSVTAAGFRDYVQRGISVNLDQQIRIDIPLEVGASADAVEVSANASPLNFDS